MSESPLTLDEVDRSILYYLQKDARNVTQTEIGDWIDVSPTTIGNRIDGLETEGVVQTYRADLDYERAGFPHRILLFCRVDPADRSHLAAAVADVRGVVSVRELLAGKQNLHVEVVGPSRDALVETIETIDDEGVEVTRSALLASERRRPLDAFAPDGESGPGR